MKGIPRAELKGHWTKSLVNFYSAAVEASANPRPRANARREASKAFGLHKDCERVHLKIVLQIVTK